jgi:hypothetical protein
MGDYGLVVSLVIGLAVGYWVRSLLITAIVAMLLLTGVQYAEGRPIEIEVWLGAGVIYMGNWVEHNLQTAGVVVVALLIGMWIRK